MTKGSNFEQDTVDYFVRVLGDELIERRVKHGSNDRGDISGLYIRGMRTVAECKCCKRMELSAWLKELETEIANDDAEIGVLIHKRKGFGKKKFGENYVTMTLETLAAIIVGGRGNLYAED